MRSQVDLDETSLLVIVVGKGANEWLVWITYRVVSSHVPSTALSAQQVLNRDQLMYKGRSQILASYANLTTLSGH